MVKLTLMDGKEVELSLNNRAIAQLGELDSAICEKYYKALADVQDNTSKRLFASMVIDYVAYLCKLILDDQYDQRMSYEDFLDQAPDDGYSLITSAVTLVTAKKAKGSATPSNEPEKEKSEAV